MMRDTRDPFLIGDLTQEMRTLGYMATLGRRWPLIDAPTVIASRRQLETGAGNEPGPWYPVGIRHAPSSSSAVRHRAAYPHGNDTAWQYTAVKTDGNGYVSEAAPPVRIDMDGTDDVIVPGLPTWPVDLWVEPTVDGEFIVYWRYDPTGQGDWPNDFEIYAGTAAGVIDYGGALDTVDFLPEQEDYEFTTGEGYADGTVKTFAVRSRSALPQAELNKLISEPVTARADGPANGVIRLGSGLHERGLR
jgi:hypothetical protein